MVDPDTPTTESLCEFTEPTTADEGRAFSAPIVRTCEAPTETVDGEGEITYVDDEPVFTAE